MTSCDSENTNVSFWIVLKFINQNGKEFGKPKRTKISAATFDAQWNTITQFKQKQVLKLNINDDTVITNDAKAESKHYIQNVSDFKGTVSLLCVVFHESQKTKKQKNKNTNKKNNRCCSSFYCREYWQFKSKESITSLC